MRGLIGIVYKAVFCSATLAQVPVEYRVLPFPLNPAKITDHRFESLNSKQELLDYLSKYGTTAPVTKDTHIDFVKDKVVAMQLRAWSHPGYKLLVEGVQREDDAYRFRFGEEFLQFPKKPMQTPAFLIVVPRGNRRFFIDINEKNIAGGTDTGS